ncbi:Protein of unknown function DUF86 [Kytococcus aerolatus]|uniref:DUF86 domain-containing protein n=1 Tax=Kytococcus aerolatus TaxID=592308 RepID=A0A212T8X5_9MICO|nr:DUF86 domain-containing protein [Kytococcus aerolatus]SNC62291.1 Protein of unknown function DUF86 [Kytococcus aerolatus]
MNAHAGLEPGTVARLRDVHRLCLRAEALADRGREWFDSDPDLGVPHLAADSLVLKLGEAVRLPAEFLEERRADPTWRRAIGMRNRIAHEYDAVDYEIVWQVVSQHAGALRLTIEEVLGQEG